MGLKSRIVVSLILSIIIAVFGYGWHLRDVYSGFNASTAHGDAYWPRETLESYSEQILGELT